MQSLRDIVNLTHAFGQRKQGVDHDQEESNWLSEHRPPALRGSTGAGPEHIFHAAVHAASEDESAKPSLRSFRR
jgi:hypothetical protein